MASAMGTKTPSQLTVLGALTLQMVLQWRPGRNLPSNIRQVEGAGPQSA